MATLRCASTLFCLLALAVMHGTCSTKPEGPQYAIDLFSALEVVTEVIDELLDVSFPVTDVNVKNAVKEMCPLIQYNYEVKNLINSDPDNVSVATQAMDVLLDSIVTESCDWLTSLSLGSDSNFNCTIEYLSTVCAEMDLEAHAFSLHYSLNKNLYSDKNLRPGGATEEAEQWIEQAFAGYSQAEQDSVLDVIKLDSSFQSCSSVDGTVTC